MTSSLREDFNRFIYGSILGEELIAKIQLSLSSNHGGTLEAMLEEHGLINPRKIYQAAEKESMRFLSSKYLRAFKIVRQIPSGDDILRNLNSVTPLCKVYLIQMAFISTSTPFLSLLSF